MSRDANVQTSGPGGTRVEKRREAGTGGPLAAWLCRRRGGHVDGRGYVRGHAIMVWSRVCSRCNRYLGPAPIRELPEEWCEGCGGWHSPRFHT